MAQLIINLSRLIIMFINFLDGEGMVSSIVFNRFRVPYKDMEEKFFVRLTNGHPIENVSKELDCLQRDFKLPDVCSSNARKVLETVKGTAGLDAATNAGMLEALKND